jgi:hypothetical protein
MRTLREWLDYTLKWAAEHDARVFTGVALRTVRTKMGVAMVKDETVHCLDDGNPEWLTIWSNTNRVPTTIRKGHVKELLELPRSRT